MEQTYTLEGKDLSIAAGAVNTDISFFNVREELLFKLEDIGFSGDSFTGYYIRGGKDVPIVPTTLKHWGGDWGDQGVIFIREYQTLLDETRRLAYPASIVIPRRPIADKDINRWGDAVLTASTIENVLGSTEFTLVGGECILLDMCGGGGGGSCCHTAQAGSGGGGGAYAQVFISCAANNTFKLEIGTGGNPGTYTNDVFTGEPGSDTVLYMWSNKDWDWVELVRCGGGKGGTGVGNSNNFRHGGAGGECSTYNSQTEMYFDWDGRSVNATDYHEVYVNVINQISGGRGGAAGLGKTINSYKDKFGYVCANDSAVRATAGLDAAGQISNAMLSTNLASPATRTTGNVRGAGAYYLSYKSGNNNSQLAGGGGCALSTCDFSKLSNSRLTYKAGNIEKVPHTHTGYGYGGACRVYTGSSYPDAGGNGGKGGDGVVILHFAGSRLTADRMSSIYDEIHVIVPTN